MRYAELQSLAFALIGHHAFILEPAGDPWDCAKRRRLPTLARLRAYSYCDLLSWGPVAGE